MKLFPGVGVISRFSQLWPSLQVIYKLIAVQQHATWNQNVFLKRNRLFLLYAQKGNLCQILFRKYQLLTRWKLGRSGMKFFQGDRDIPTLAQFWKSLQFLYKLVSTQQLATWNEKVLA